MAADWHNRILCGHVLEVLPTLPAGIVQCCVTSPPYWGLRAYGTEPQVWGGGVCTHDWSDELVAGGGSQTQGGNSQRSGRANVDAQVQRGNSQGNFCRLCRAWRGELGLEPTPELYCEHMVSIFREVKRVLRDDGVLFLNIGDSYTSGGRKERDPGQSRKHPAYEGENFADGLRPGTPSGLKPKDLCGIPWRLAFALQADGWYWRGWMPWVKRSAMPESTRDRPTSALEIVHIFAKQPRYFWDQEAVRKELRCPEDSTPEDQARAFSRRRSTSPVPRQGIKEPEGSTPPGRNFRNTDLYFESIESPHGMVFADDEPVGLDVNPAGFSEAHFATFPPKLIEPLIKAGTSEKGCCPECGKAWGRTVERSSMKVREGRKGRVTRTHCSGTMIEPPRAETIGWKPACRCGFYGDCPTDDMTHLGSVPCLVLDPFLGSGTVAKVAAGLGRAYLGIELNPEYVEMAKARIHGPLFAETVGENP